MCNRAVLLTFGGSVSNSLLPCCASTQYCDQHLHFLILNDIAQNMWSLHKAPAPRIQDHISFFSWSILLSKFLSVKPYFTVAVVIEAVTKMLYKIHTFHRSRRLISIFSWNLQWFLSWASLFTLYQIYFNSTFPSVSWSSQFLILFKFSEQNNLCIPHLSHMCSMSYLSGPWLCQPNNIWC